MHLKAEKKNSMTYAMYLYVVFKQDLIYIGLLNFSLNHKFIQKKEKIENRKINEASNLIRYEIKKKKNQNLANYSQFALLKN